MADSMPEDAVAGLAEVLRSLGDELREANSIIGQRKYSDFVEPVLLFNGATVEMDLALTRSVKGGVDAWVLSADGERTRQNAVRITVHLNGPEGGLPAGA